MLTRQNGASRRGGQLGSAQRRLVTASCAGPPPVREGRAWRLLGVAMPLVVAAAASTPAAAAVPSHTSAEHPNSPPGVKKPSATGAKARLGAITTAEFGLDKLMEHLHLWPTYAPPTTAREQRDGAYRQRTAQSYKENSLAIPGVVEAFGDAAPRGEHRSSTTNLVGVAPAHCGHGYWAVSATGQVFPYGCAGFYGSLARRPPGGAAGIAAAPSGRGYWVVSRDGDVYSFGGARFYGSLGHRPLPAPVVGMSATPAGHGYWLATANGGVYSFGDARFFGSLGHSGASSPVVGIASSPRGGGYWLATAGGGVFSFGGARFFGSGAGRLPAAPVTALASPPSAEGYWLLTARGHVYSFGHAPRLGSVQTKTGTRASSLAATPDGRGFFVATAVAAAAKKRQAFFTSKLKEHRGGVTREGTEQKPGQVHEQGALRYLGTFMVTCYDMTGITASGAVVGPESVAVDPSVIPLGTRIYVQGVGTRVADDTGGAIIGNHIDIWEPSYSTCTTWGVQERAVYAVV